VPLHTLQIARRLAKKRQRSVQEEIRGLLIQMFDVQDGAWARRADRIRKRLARTGKAFSDSVTLLREGSGALVAVSRVVLDPSVVIKWYVPEENADKAMELKEWILGGAHRMIVPTLFFRRDGQHSLEKETLRNEVLPRTAREIIWEILRLPLQVYVDRHELLPKALDIARELKVTRL